MTHAKTLSKSRPDGRLKQRSGHPARILMVIFMLLLPAAILLGVAALATLVMLPVAWLLGWL